MEQLQGLEEALDWSGTAVTAQQWQAVRGRRGCSCGAGLWFHGILKNPRMHSYTANPFNLPTDFAIAGSDMAGQLAAASEYASQLVALLAGRIPAPIELRALLDSHPTRFFLDGWNVKLNGLADSEVWKNWLGSLDRLSMPRSSREPAAFQGRDRESAKNVPRIEKLLTSRKKEHELERFTNLAAGLGATCGCSRAVDAGAGTGRLGRMLAAKHGIPCLGLENDPSAVKRSQRRTEWAEADARNRRGREPGVEGKLPSTAPALASEVLQGTLDAEIGRHLEKFSSTLAEDKSSAAGALLVGLHACGELTVTTCRTFVEAKDLFSALAIVGCCYQHAEAFPLSTTVVRLLEAGGLDGLDDFNSFLPKRGRELATLSCDESFFSSQSETTRRGIREKAFARALLESLHAELHGRGLQCKACSMVEDSKSLDSQQLPGKHPYDPRQPFSVYAEEALGPSSAELGDLNARHTEARLASSQLQLFNIARNRVGALVEALLVIDRAMFLAEQGAEVELVPIFEPSISPRNLALFAWNTEKKA